MTTVSNNQTANSVLASLARSEPVQKPEEDQQGRFLKLFDDAAEEPGSDEPDGERGDDFPARADEHG
ncbi:hypothetical protein TMEC50S_00724 [Thauera mechernichensis]